MSLVDDEQADRPADRRKDTGDKFLVAKALGRDQKDIDLIGSQLPLDLLPLLSIARMNRGRPDSEPAGHGDLVAHEREERADDQGRPVPGVTSEARRDPVAWEYDQMAERRPVRRSTERNRGDSRKPLTIPSSPSWLRTTTPSVARL